RQHLFIGLFEDLTELAGGRRGDLDGDLVGLELEQRLVLADRISGSFAPTQNRGLGPLLVHGGNHIGNAARIHTALSALMPAAILSTLGSTASSSTGLCGLGMSGMARRSTGASRSKKASLASTAAISAPNPAVMVSSCTIKQ